MRSLLNALSQDDEQLFCFFFSSSSCDHTHTHTPVKGWWTSLQHRRVQWACTINTRERRKEKKRLQMSSALCVCVSLSVTFIKVCPNECVSFFCSLRLLFQHRSHRDASECVKKVITSSSSSLSVVCPVDCSFTLSERERREMMMTCTFIVWPFVVSGEWITSYSYNGQYAWVIDNRWCEVYCVSHIHTSTQSEINRNSHSLLWILVNWF